MHPSTRRSATGRTRLECARARAATSRTGAREGSSWPRPWPRRLQSPTPSTSSIPTTPRSRKRSRRWPSACTERAGSSMTSTRPGRSTLTSATASAGCRCASPRLTCRSLQTRPSRALRPVGCCRCERFARRSAPASSTRSAATCARCPAFPPPPRRHGLTSTIAERSSGFPRRAGRHRRQFVVVSLTAVAPLAAAGLFGLVSGFNDGGNLMASFTSGRLITPRVAAALLLFSVAGPLVIGTAVAQTVGTNVIDLRGQGELDYVLITLSSLSVVLLSWRIGIPTSMTLALVGAMLGWVAAGGELGLIHWRGVARILLGMPISVLGGGLLALLLYAGVRRYLGGSSHASILGLARFQFATAAIQAFAYGANDMEKTVGLIAVGLSFPNHGQAVVFWGPTPIIGAFVLFFLGAIFGGARVARRIGSGVLKVRPMQALAQQLASGGVVSVLAIAGAPVSMTQTIDGGLVGVRAAQRASSIRWGIVREIVGS